MTGVQTCALPIYHRPGGEVEGTVESFASHGAFVTVGSVRCYVPLSAMGDPAPTRSRDVLTQGETRAFIVQAIDAPRRGIELALPGFAKPAAAPSDETVAAETRQPRKAKGAAKRTAKPADKHAKASTANKAAATKTPAKQAKTAAKKAPARQPTKKVTTKKTPAKQTAKAVAKPTTKVTTKKVTTKKVTKAAPAKRTAAKKVPAKQTKTAAKKTAAKRSAKTTKRKG